jgi:hypothetical protein
LFSFLLLLALAYEDGKMKECSPSIEFPIFDENAFSMILKRDWMFLSISLTFFSYTRKCSGFEEVLLMEERGDKDRAIGCCKEVLLLFGRTLNPLAVLSRLVVPFML